MSTDKSDNLDEVRDLINAKRGFKSINQVALETGIDKGAISRFLRRETNALHVDTCLRLARWLGLSRGLILRMAGHTQMADLLDVDEPSPPRTRIEEQLSLAMSGLTDSEREALLQVVRANAAILKENRAVYDIKSNGGKIIGK